MRIGNDFILFTKKGRQLTCLMLSRTFHDRESIETIICPMPVWDCDSQKPVLQTGGIERVSNLDLVVPCTSGRHNLNWTFVWATYIICCRKRLFIILKLKRSLCRHYKKTFFKFLLYFAVQNGDRTHIKVLAIQNGA